MTARFSLRLRERRALTPHMLHLVLEAEGAAPTGYRPGQFIQLFLRDGQGQELRRSFSLASPPPTPGQPARWELAMSVFPDGAISGRMGELALGSPVEAAGPFGRFGFQANDRPARCLMVATGSGIAPYRSMLDEIRRRAGEHRTRFVLLCGARRRTEVPWLDEFSALADDLPNFEVIACLSREAVPDGDPRSLAGRVQRGLERLAPQADDLVMLCGQPGMVDDCAERLAQAGLPRRLIRRERYVHAG